MMEPITLLDGLFILFAYLAGSVSSAIIICKLMGLPDPRTQGSNNPGATNVLRFGGKRVAAVVLAGDVLKGIIPVAIAHAFGLSASGMALTAFAAFLGHLYPVFFKFKGGKGVATALGVLLALAWQVGLAVALTWFVVSLVSRISSLSALTATILIPFYMWWLAPAPEYIAMGSIMSLILIWRHKSNIRNLLTGKESKIGGGTGK